MIVGAVVAVDRKNRRRTARVIMQFRYQFAIISDDGVNAGFFRHRRDISAMRAPA